MSSVTASAAVQDVVDPATAEAALGVVITDQPARLEGEWTPEQFDRLVAALNVAAPRRRTREADVRESRYLRRMVFKLGDVVSVEYELEEIPNPAAIWGGGISGDDVTTVTIPKVANGQDLGATLAGLLPESVLVNRDKIEAWRRDVADVYNPPSLCQSVLRFLGRRGR